MSNSTALLTYRPSSQNEIQLLNRGFLIIAGNDNEDTLFSVDNSGNMVATSLMTTKGSYARTTGSSGTARTLYAPHTTAPVTEDGLSTYYER